MNALAVISRPGCKGISSDGRSNHGLCRDRRKSQDAFKSEASTAAGTSIATNGGTFLILELIRTPPVPDRPGCKSAVQGPLAANRAPGMTMALVLTSGVLRSAKIRVGQCLWRMAPGALRRSSPDQLAGLRDAMDTKQESADQCGGCGLAVPGGTARCQSIMDELLALHFSDATYFSVHRLFVDTYCLQHPDRYCVSFKSLAAHLAHLCWSLEYQGSGAIPSEAIRHWVERHPHLDKPVLPTHRGALTIADVARAADPSAHHRAVQGWALATWEAYTDLQSLGRHWVKQALEGGLVEETREPGRTPADSRLQPTATRVAPRAGRGRRRG
jgi:hypothetical protein